MVRRVETDLLGEDWPGTLEEHESRLLNEAVEEDADELHIFVWSEEPSLSRAGIFLNEAIGNRTVKLTGQYSFRYDPPRSASTGAARRFLSIQRGRGNRRLEFDGQSPPRVPFGAEAAEESLRCDRLEVVCRGKSGPFLKRAREGIWNGEWHGRSAIYAGADHRESA